MKSRVFKKAWSLIKEGTYELLSEALKAAWKYIKLQIKLAAGEVKIRYRKKDGTIRHALATAVKNSSYQHKGSTKKTKAAIVTYYDIEAQGIRSFNIWQLMAA